MIISLVAAIGKGRELGFQGKMPWHLPEDFARFRALTMGHYLVMGKKTFASIGKPLPGRISLVLTSHPQQEEMNMSEEVKYFNSIDALLAFAKESNTRELFVVGGGEIYKLFYPLAKRMYLTHVDYEGEADTFFPDYDLKEWLAFCLDVNYKLPAKRGTHTYSFVSYERISCY
ncbi:MAG: dihydrofolate reductase [Oligoflexia bacterium]|nr:dihydrofolate reductase [Oligoflexia bacterium]MBF0367189.1 dihydrofolate reductase [Oligoflexia bacterium]